MASRPAPEPPPLISSPPPVIPCVLCQGTPSEPDLRGGGWWDVFAGNVNRRAWDERDHEMIHADLFQQRAEQLVPPENVHHNEQFTMKYANVTSWQKHGAALTGANVDLIVSVETRIAPDVWQGALARIHGQGYMAIAGHGLTQQNGVTYNGVAILARQPASIGEIALPRHFQEQWPGRVVAGRYFPPNAKHYVLVVAAYAPFVGSLGPEANAHNQQFHHSAV